jgi:hypothetical protein
MSIQTGQQVAVNLGHSEGTTATLMGKLSELK